MLMSVTTTWGFQLVHALERFTSALDDHHIVPFGLKAHLDHAAGESVVVDDQMRAVIGPPAEGVSSNT